MNKIVFIINSLFIDLSQVLKLEAYFRRNFHYLNQTPITTIVFSRHTHYEEEIKQFP
jgi:pyridoxal/pyridoxine/pyridoxamine kinase